jgi:hypothetical protein
MFQKMGLGCVEKIPRQASLARPILNQPPIVKVVLKDASQKNDHYSFRKLNMRMQKEWRLRGRKQERKAQGTQLASPLFK